MQTTQTIEPEIMCDAIADVLAARVEALLTDRELCVLDRIACVQAGTSLSLGDVTDRDVEGLEAAGLLVLRHAGPFTHLDFTAVGAQLVAERREGARSPAQYNLLRDAEDNQRKTEAAL